VPAELIEVADAFGTTPRQKLIKVQLPVALPTIMAGVNQCIMLALSMTVIASMIGGRRARLPGARGYPSALISAWGSRQGLPIVIIAVILDRITQNVVPPQQEDR